MENFNLFIDYIARTNLFNFVIFLSIIIFLIKKIDIKSKLVVAQSIVKDSIVASETVKVQSEERLSSIENSIANIENEIEAIIEKSSESAQLVGKKILQDGEKSALVIKENAYKTIENSKLILKNELLKKASLASVEVAKKHIINELNANSDLHQKLINESLEALEEINATTNPITEANVEIEPGVDSEVNE